MRKVEKIILCYFFEKLDYHPKDKLKELSDEIKDLFDDSFVFCNEDIHHMYSMPRIQALSKNKKMLFQMSLINANIVFHINSDDEDEVVLWINNHLQLFFDILKNVFDAKILYSSIKVISIYEEKDIILSLAKKVNLDEEMENMSFNRGFAKDNTYYLNVLYNTNKEYNFNFVNNDKLSEQDLFDMTMITSLQDAELKREYLVETIEVNDRLAFNQDRNYFSTKENLRGMIMELRKSFNVYNLENNE